MSDCLGLSARTFVVTAVRGWWSDELTGAKLGNNYFKGAVGGGYVSRWLECAAAKMFVQMESGRPVRENDGFELGLRQGRRRDSDVVKVAESVAVSKKVGE